MPACTSWRSARPHALYRRAGVDPRIVHGFDALDVEALDESRCGGSSRAPRHFLYFDDAQMEHLGIAPVSGRIGGKVDPADAGRSGTKGNVLRIL